MRQARPGAGDERTPISQPAVGRAAVPQPRDVKNLEEYESRQVFNRRLARSIFALIALNVLIGTAWIIAVGALTWRTTENFSLVPRILTIGLVLLYLAIEFIQFPIGDPEDHTEAESTTSTGWPEDSKSTRVGQNASRQAKSYLRVARLMALQSLVFMVLRGGIGSMCAAAALGLGGWWPWLGMMPICSYTLTAVIGVTATLRIISGNGQASLLIAVPLAGRAVRDFAIRHRDIFWQLRSMLVATVVSVVSLVTLAFASMTASLRQLRGRPVSDDPSDALLQSVTLYLWHLANAVPLLDVTKTLRWTEPKGFEDTLTGSLLLIYRTLVAIPLLAGIVRLSRVVWEWKSKPANATAEESRAAPS